MNENHLIEIIRSITKSNYIGDDCANIKALGIVVTQDSLVEDIHFKTSWMSPFELGEKSVLVNISDIFASGAEPAYLTISLSIPGDIGEEFVLEFYYGVQNICDKYSIETVGGDLTGSDKIYISVCAIGRTGKRNISSRGFAKPGYKVVVCGQHGSSAAGLRLLECGINEPHELIIAHKLPELYPEFTMRLASEIKQPYAMMDTSDGLADALFKIAKQSGITINADFNKIPHLKLIEQFTDWRKMVLFGGEDYGIAAVVPDEYTLPEGGVVIGLASQFYNAPLRITIDEKTVEYPTIDQFTFKHFSG